MKRSIVATLLIVGLLVVTATSIYVIFFTPRAQAERLAQRVMQNAYEQNEAVFRQYGDPSDEFYAAANQRNYRLDSLVEQDATFFIRYTFTDRTSPRSARITIQGNRVTSTAVGDNLGATSEKDRHAPPTTPTRTTCLLSKDLRFLDSTRLYAKIIRGATMIFDDTTTIDYVHMESSNEILDRMSNFYKGASKKDFSFLLRGYIPVSSPQDEARLSTIYNRATKIQEDLVKRGIPYDRIQIGKPVAFNADQTNGDNNDHYIIIDVVNNCVD